MRIEVNVKDVQQLTGWTYEYARRKHKEWREKWGVTTIDIPLFLEKRYNRTFHSYSDLVQFVRQIGLRK